MTNSQKIMNSIVFIFVSMLNLICGQEFMTDNVNWTSCEEFLHNTTFDHHKVVDIDWKIFYFWNEMKERSYNIRFSPAASILVDRFEVELSKLDPTVNWTRAVLFMETAIDFSALYIKTDTSGKFRLIPGQAFHADSIPVLMFGLKLVEPGYLGIMNCKRRVCYALAPVGQMPKDDELYHAALKIGFYGSQNRSYLSQYDARPTLSPYQEDNSEDDEEVEIYNESLPEL